MGYDEARDAYFQTVMQEEKMTCDGDPLSSDAR